MNKTSSWQLFLVLLPNQSATATWLWRRFLGAGWETIPVHPAGGSYPRPDRPPTSAWQTARPNPTVVSVYLGPKYFPAEIPAIAALNQQWVWLNPGADDPAMVAAAEAAGLGSRVMPKYARW